MSDIPSSTPTPKEPTPTELLAAIVRLREWCESTFEELEISTREDHRQNRQKINSVQQELEYLADRVSALERNAR